jgi:hypothetical protein
MFMYRARSTVSARNCRCQDLLCPAIWGKVPGSVTLAAPLPALWQSRLLPPRRQLLQRPGIAVGVAEGDEGAPRLDVNVAGLDAMSEELLASGLHVGDHDLDPFLGARRHVGDAGAHDDGARRPGRGELHKPQRLVHLVVVIGVETDLIHIEGSRAVNIGHRYRYQFDLPVHAGHAIPRLRH